MSTLAKKNEIIYFFLLVILLSIPFFVLGAFIDLTKYIPIKLPISALALLCPMLAAIILTKKDRKIALFKRVFDYKKITNYYWYIPIFLLIPMLMCLTFFMMKWLQIPLPKFEIKLSDAFVLVILFFIGAIGEELGWTVYATDVLQRKQGFLKTALIIGVVWAVWHIIPYWQAHRTFNWIFWQCIGTVALRIIMVWLYDKTGQSVFATIICHTTINLSEFYFPNYGSQYDPFYFGITLILTAVIISFFSFSREPLKAKWQPKTD